MILQAEVRARAREEAQKRLDINTRQIISENNQMSEELRFQEGTIREMQNDGGKIQAAILKLKKELALKQDTAKVHAQHNFKKSQEIKELQVLVTLRLA